MKAIERRFLKDLEDSGDAAARVSTRDGIVFVIGDREYDVATVAACAKRGWVRYPFGDAGIAITPAGRDALRGED